MLRTLSCATPLLVPAIAASETVSAISALCFMGSVLLTPTLIGRGEERPLRGQGSDPGGSADGEELGASLGAKGFRRQLRELVERLGDRRSERLDRLPGMAVGAADGL